MDENFKDLTPEIVRKEIIPMLEAWCDGRLYCCNGKELIPVWNGEGGVSFEARATKKNFTIEFHVHSVEDLDDRDQRISLLIYPKMMEKYEFKEVEHKDWREEKV